MENFDKVIDFVAGVLNQEEEEGLLLAMSSDEELRSFFKSHVSIKTAIQSNLNYFTPPPSTTIGLFAKAGIDYRSFANKNDKQFGLSKYFHEFRKNFYWSLAGAAAMAILFSLQQLFLPGIITNSNAGNVSTYASKAYEGSNTGIESNQELNVKSNRDLPHISSFANNPKESLDDNKKHVLAENILEPAQDTDYSYVNKLSPVIFLQSGNIKEFKEFSNYEPFALIILHGNSTDYRLSALVQNNNSFYLPEQPISNVSGQFINPSFQLILDFNRNVSFGLDLRAETFGQRAYFENDNYLQIREIANKFITSSAFILIKGNIENEFIPFGEVSGGFNSGGFVLRFQSGIEYRLNSEFSLYAGMEYSSLFYSFAGVNANSNKFGLSYGVKYSLATL